MEAVFTLLKGYIIGLSVAAPVGPIGLLCVRQTLHKGAWVGLVAGLGAACADALYGMGALFSLSLIVGLISEYEIWLRLIGGLFLLGLGLHTYRHRLSSHVAQSKRDGLVSAWATTFVLTVANPQTLLLFVAVFAGAGFLSDISVAEDGIALSLAVVLSVFLGSASWWLGLSFGISRIRHRLSDKTMVLINHISGIGLMIVGSYGLASSLWMAAALR